MDEVTQKSLRRTDIVAELCDFASNSLDPIFWEADRVGAASAWWQHVPFGHWIVSRTKPSLLVELGTHTGVSYSAFCRAVIKSELDTRCYAIDTWRGDSQAGFYGDEIFEEFRHFHDERYSAFSNLLRTSFDEALDQFASGTIDLLHIDGLHTYDAVRHDFETWKPKLSRRAVVLLHDTSERKEDFGVWRLWGELREEYPHFEFLHGHGLGMLVVGKDVDPAVMALCQLSEPSLIATIRSRLAALGERCQSSSREKALAQALGLATIGEHAEIARHSIAATTIQAKEARRLLEATTEARRAQAVAEAAEAQLRSEVNDLRGRAAAVAADLEACQLEVVTARTEAARLLTAGETAEKACAALREALLHAHQSNAVLSTTVERLEAELSKARSSVEQSEARLASILTSRSWRATALLRWVSSMVYPRR